MAKKLSPPDVSKAFNPPRLPGNPIKAANAKRERADQPHIDRLRLRGGPESMSARELATVTRGPLVSEHETSRQFDADHRKHARRRRSPDYGKRPLQLKRRSLGGKR